MADYGTSDTSTTNLGANQFPISDVYVPNVGLRATEGGPVSTDLGGKASSPTSMYVKDGGNVVEGSTTDAAVTGDNPGTLSAKLRGLNKIWADVWDSANHLFHFNQKQIGGTAIDTNSGNKSAGTQRVVLATDQPAVPVSGTFWQATQPVSGTVSVNALPAGSNLIGSVELVDSAGTNKAAIDSAGNQQVKGGFTEVAGQGTGVVTGVGTFLLPETDISAYKHFSMTLSGTWSLTLIVEVSDTSGANYETLIVNRANLSVFNFSSLTANGTYDAPLKWRYMRVRVSAFTSNTSLAGMFEFHTSPAPVSVVYVGQAGTLTVQPGNTANTTPWLVQGVTSTTGGSTLFHVISAASNNATSLKGSAGMLYGGSISNTNASARYVKFYNKATAPAPATDNALILWTLQVPGNATVPIAIPEGGVFSNGIAFAAVVNMSDTDNTSIGAGDLSIDLRYK